MTAMDLELDLGREIGKKVLIFSRFEPFEEKICFSTTILYFIWRFLDL